MLVSIVTSGHDVADARLHREVAALARAGLQVEVLGIGDRAQGPAGAQVRTWRRKGKLGRAGLALTLPWRAKGKVLIALDPDSQIGTWLRSVFGRILPRRRIATVADVHEDYAALLRDRRWARRQPIKAVAQLVARLGTKVAEAAELTVVADEFLLPEAPRRLVLRNLPDLSMLPALEDRVKAAEPTAVYVGDVRASRGLFTMLESIRLAPAWRLTIVGPLRAADQERLDELLTDPNLASRVTIHGRMAPREAWATVKDGWVGFLMLESTAAFAAAMPSKVYEYLAMGMPILSTELPRPAKLIRENQLGEVASDPRQAAEILNTWAGDDSQLRVLEKNVRRYHKTEQVMVNEYDIFARAIGSLLPVQGREDN